MDRAKLLLASDLTRRWTLASKIILSLGTLLIGLAIGVAALTFMQVRQTAFMQLEGKGIALADALNYTFEVLLGQDSIPSLQRVTENSATIPDVRKILIVRRDRQILASNDHVDVGKQIDTPLLRAYLERADWQRSTQLTDNGELIIIQPLRGGQFGGGLEPAERGHGGQRGGEIGRDRVTRAHDVNRPAHRQRRSVLNLTVRRCRQNSALGERDENRLAVFSRDGCRDGFRLRQAQATL